MVADELVVEGTGVMVACGTGLLLLLLLLLAVTGGVLLEVTLITCRTSLCPEAKEVLEDVTAGVETTGVTEIPAGRGEGPWLGLRRGGEGDDAGLSKQITWGLTDPEEGGENVVPLLPPPAGVSNPPVPFKEQERDFLKTRRFPGSTSPTHQESFDLVPSEPCGVVLPGAAVLEAGVGGAGVVWPLAGRLAGGGSVSSSSSLSVRVIISGSADFFLLLTSSTIGASPSSWSLVSSSSLSPLSVSTATSDFRFSNCGSCFSFLGMSGVQLPSL